MFTGIISHVGEFTQFKNHRLTFSAEEMLCQKLTRGASISVNGVCLTVVDLPAKNIFCVEVMPETSTRTNLGTLRENDPVNLELPATPESFLAGHIVQGHIDGTGIIQDISTSSNSKIITIKIKPVLCKYIVEKGSVAINGVSLTVIKSANDFFTVSIIPYTWEHTAFNNLKTDDSVNIETDIIAKYVERLSTK